MVQKRVLDWLSRSAGRISFSNRLCVDCGKSFRPGFEKVQIYTIETRSEFRNVSVTVTVGVSLTD